MRLGVDRRLDAVRALGIPAQGQGVDGATPLDLGE
jgi:hypothetical protein